MSSQVKIADRSARRRRMWPIMGFLLIMALTVVAYLTADQVIAGVKALLPQFKTTGMSNDTLRLVFTAIVAALMSLITALVIAAAAPKKSINVKTSDLQKERAYMVDDKRKRKKQQRRINREYREHVEGKKK